MLILGSRNSQIGSIPLPEHCCNNCNSSGQMQMSFYASYAHILQIPLFSTGRKAVAECTNCQEVLEEEYFTHDLTEVQQQVNAKTIVPPLHFIGLGIMVVAVLCFEIFY